MAETMRVAVGQFSELSREQLSFARQLGAAGVQRAAERTHIAEVIRGAG